MNKNNNATEMKALYVVVSTREYNGGEEFYFSADSVCDSAEAAQQAMLESIHEQCASMTMNARTEEEIFAKAEISDGEAVLSDDGDIFRWNISRLDAPSPEEAGSSKSADETDEQLKCVLSSYEPKGRKEGMDRLLYESIMMPFRRPDVRWNGVFGRVAKIYEETTEEGKAAFKALFRELLDTEFVEFMRMSETDEVTGDEIVEFMRRYETDGN